MSNLVLQFNLKFGLHQNTIAPNLIYPIHKFCNKINIKLHSSNSKILSAHLFVIIAWIYISLFLRSNRPIHLIKTYFHVEDNFLIKNKRNSKFSEF